MAGLGLAIVDRIVKRHSGKIHIGNHSLGGLKSFFIFRLQDKNAETSEPRRLICSKSKNDLITKRSSITYWPSSLVLAIDNLI